MKFCKAHWEELRAAIDIRGLSHLIAKDGKEAASRMKDEVMGVETKDTYDPLMNAHNMMLGRALEMGGLYLLGTPPEGEGHDGHWCPLCEVDKHCPPEHKPPEGCSTAWINGCTDAVKKHCVEQGLIDKTV